jgi:hypothetical protein
MSLRLSNRSQFSFNGQTFTVTSVSVESPEPEIVNMTAIGATVRQLRLVPTGDIVSPGKIAVEAFGFVDPSEMVGTVGEARFATTLGTVVQQVICDSANVEAQVADLLRIRFSLTMTSYQGT